MAFSPLVQVLTISPPYPWDNHALFQYGFIDIVGWVHLIKDAYLHDDKTKYMSCITIGHRQRFRSPKHITNKSMVGLLPLAPHHD